MSLTQILPWNKRPILERLERVVFATDLRLLAEAEYLKTGKSIEAVRKYTAGAFFESLLSFADYSDPVGVLELMYKPEFWGE
jgi:hypothetical protein